MSTAPKPALEWICIIHDFPDALERRLAVRPKHLENLNAIVAAGTIPFGGVMLSEQPASADAPLGFKGSVLAVVADTKEQVLEILKKDPYVENKVWDLEKVYYKN